MHVTSKTRFWRRGRVDDGIKAYSNRPALTLFLNGTRVGELPNGAFRHRNGRKVDNVFHWRVRLREGRNDVRVTDAAGHQDTAVVYYNAPGLPPPAPGPDDPIEELRSSNPRAPALLVAQPVRAQWPFYGEFDGTADNTFDRLPPEVEGASWISTPRLSKPENRTRISFRLRRDAEVFVMTSGAGSPGAPFQELEGSRLWRDNDLRLVPCRLYRRAGRAGDAHRPPDADRATRSSWSRPGDASHKTWSSAFV